MGDVQFSLTMVPTPERPDVWLHVPLVVSNVILPKLKSSLFSVTKLAVASAQSSPCELLA